MIRLIRRSALLIALSLAPINALRAEGVLDQAPPDAMGFAIVRNLAATDAKIQRVMKIFESLSEVHPPAPLAFIKTATGIGEGLNDNGDALIALLPGDADPMSPKPLLLVPVSDYAKFAESIGGDASGEICRVTIVGEEVLIAKRGDYAMLMNVEHRPRMEAILASDAPSAPPIAALVPWLGKNDFAVVLLPAGVDALTAAAQTGLASQRTEMENQFSDPQFAEMAANVKQALDMYDSILGFCNTEIAAGAIGMSIDDATNIRISDRVVFEKDGELAKLEDIPKLDQSPLIGYPAGPFVFAGGGPLPQAFSEFVSKMSRKTMEKYPEKYGFQNFDEEKWNKIEESWKAATAGLRSMSVALLPGGKDDAIVSNIFYIVHVDDADAYFASSRKSMELWNELVAASSSDIKLPYEITDVVISGKKGMLMSVDIAAAAADENVPMLRPMFQAAFGADGKMRMYTIAADPTTVVMGIGKEEQVAEAVKHAISGDGGLAQSSDVQTTATLLDPAAPWTGYVSPQGCVLWFKRIFLGLAGTVGMPAVTIPEYPVGPPLGFSTNLTAGQLHGEMVVPVKAMQDLAAYIKICEGL
jgi:hypothetical protein